MRVFHSKRCDLLGESRALRYASGSRPPEVYRSTRCCKEPPFCYKRHIFAYYSAKEFRTMLCKYANRRKFILGISNLDFKQTNFYVNPHLVAKSTMNLYYVRSLNLNTFTENF